MNCFLVQNKLSLAPMKFLFLTLLSLGIATAAPHPEYEPADPQSQSAASAQSNNLFQGKSTTASGSWDKDTPEVAVDGKIDANRYWGCENLPVWHQIDMGKPTALANIKFYPYWADGRVYKFKIEGSNDGKKWKTLVDQSANSITGSPEGFNFQFPVQNVRYVRSTFLDSSKGKANGGHLVEIQGFGDNAGSALQGSAVNLDKLYPRQGSPADSDKLKGIYSNAWRGERINGRIALWGNSAVSQVRFSCTNLRNKQGATIPLQASFLRYVVGAGEMRADVVDVNQKMLDIPAGTMRGLWVWADIPREAATGVYRGLIVASAAGSPDIKIPVEINVLKTTIPEPKNWQFHLNIWQHPQAVARWHNVPAWSDEHFALLKPQMKRLAEAGQKSITTSIIDEAWNEQTYDTWPSMIEWRKKKDGSWEYDYSIFDKYVNFMINEVGINKQISCYTMIPWSMKVRYFDEASNSYKDYPLDPNNPSYEALWGPFLKSFSKHLKEKGWTEIACLSLDERPDHLVMAAKEMMHKYAPELKIDSAVDSPSKKMDEVYDISPMITHCGDLFKDDSAILKARKAKGYKTTHYVCCNPAKPNNFVTSEPAEGEWLAIFSAANKLDGFLRWAYHSWPVNPLVSSDFGNWKSGDTFLVYPGNLTSPRFERLRDGIENFEKINLIRQAASKTSAPPAFKQAAKAMEETLKQSFTIERSKGDEHTQDVIKANEAILKASQAL